MLDPPRYSADVGPMFFRSPSLISLLVFGLKEEKLGHLTREFGSQRGGFSFLQRGKPLGFLNPMAKLSLGEEED